MNGVALRCCGVLAVAGLFLAGCTSHPLAEKEAAYPAEKVDAQALFVENCSICHGQKGNAHTFHGWLVGAQNLTRTDWQSKTPDDEILHAIESGSSVMPEFDKKLSPAEIQALAAYVRTLKQKN